MSFFHQCSYSTSFKSLVELLPVDLHVNDTCTKRQPYGASGWMHESDEGHPSNSSTANLTDEMVDTVVAGGGAVAEVDARA